MNFESIDPDLGMATFKGSRFSIPEGSGEFRGWDLLGSIGRRYVFGLSWGLVFGSPRGVLACLAGLWGIGHVSWTDFLPAKLDRTLASGAGPNVGQLCWTLFWLWG